MANTYTQILRAGTYEQYQALATKDSNLLYFCTDNGKLFKGEVDFTNNLVYQSSAPVVANAVPGKIYVDTTDGAMYALNAAGTAIITLGKAPLASSSGATTLDNTVTDSTVPTSLNVYLYGQDILAQAVGGSAVVKDVNAGSADAQVVVTYGDDSTSGVTVPGVVTGLATGNGGVVVTESDGSTSAVTVGGVVTGLAAGSGAGEVVVTANAADGTSGTSAVTVPGVVASVAASTSAEATVVITPTTGAASNVLVPGVVTTPTWDNTSRTLTLPVSGTSTPVTVEIGKDLGLESGYYDTTTKEIVLVLNDPEETEIRVSVADLIDIYTGGSTDTATVSVSTSNVITAAVKLDQATGNAITVVQGATGGLRVDLSDVYDEISALASATTAWGSFT